jgi:hypothetical protein
MDTHADTSCAGANWSLMELTGEICDVNPFLVSYQPVQEIPVARCCTIWTDQTNSMEYLLVLGDQMLWFGAQLPNSLLNPQNQMRAYGIGVYDDPFDTSCTFGIDSSDQAFIPFETTETVVHFESRVPTEWERCIYRLYCLRVRIGVTGVVKSTICRMVVGLRMFLHIWWPTPRLAVPYLQSSARFVDRSERERLFHFANVTLYRSL